MLALRLFAGIAMLFLGRQLFWLFVGAAGFLFGMDIVGALLGRQPEWLILVIALIFGIVGAVLAVFLQHAAVGIAGFLAGGYIVLNWLDVLGLERGVIVWALFAVGGIIGAILAAALFDWALIILSSFAGAAVIVQIIHLPLLLALGAFAVLVLVGIAVQAGMYLREPRGG
jgi:hypothetical protein